MDGGKTKSMSNKDPSNTVTFTPLQLQYLESVFPAMVFPSTATENSVHQYFGTQSVLETVRSKTSGLRNGLRT